MNILGISCYYHDAAAALLRDGQLIAAAEEERFTRIKHDFGFPHQAIRFCLESGGIAAGEVDYAVFYEKPFRKFDRILMSVLQTYPQSYKVFRESMITWMIDKLWVGSKISAELGIPLNRILYSEHHMSHAASAFLCSPFEEAAILTVDGVGEWVTGTWGIGRGNQIDIRKQMMFPHSLGLLYSAFTAFLGFEVNEGEYKVMGMAPYGQPRYVDKVWKLIRQEADGSFSLDMDYFCFQHSTERTFNNRFVQLFGEPRPPTMLFFTADSGFPAYFGEPPANFNEVCRLNQHYADIAASIQQVTEEVLITMARQLQKETGLRKLCIAGGVGLNSVANHRILRETPFDDIFIQPSAGDGGGALGAALWADNMLLGNPRRFRMDHAYWGKAYSDAEVHQFLEGNGIPYEQVDDDDRLLDLAVERLQRGNVIGWYQGRFEWGPRALGNRSILADARNPRMKDIVNTKIKFREPYRPFAPSVLAERTEEFFELPNAREHYPARYMLYVVPVRQSKHNVLPAITHVDGTGRLQTVFEDVNSRYHRLIKRFSQATGVPAVLNTSFNLKGEPIVNTPANAFSTFSRSEMDMLFLGNFVVEKERLQANRQQLQAEPVGAK
ncbi:MAG TPA: carbamoyltransferase N-terminal domain-containing protein [Candidatus Binatia bacterium]|nr:carbamoyltransferase N-terminal domain-containing protein [Candidatus Binatia bacterium]